MNKNSRILIIYASVLIGTGQISAMTTEQILWSSPEQRSAYFGRKKTIKPDTLPPVQRIAALDHAYADMYTIPAPSKESTRLEVAFDPVLESLKEQNPQRLKEKYASTKTYSQPAQRPKTAHPTSSRSPQSISSQGSTELPSLDLSSTSSMQTQPLFGSNRSSVTSTRQESLESEQKVSADRAAQQPTMSKKISRLRSEINAARDESQQPTTLNEITSNPTMNVHNNSTGPIEITVAIRQPWDPARPETYDPNDATSYNHTSQKHTLEPNSNINIDVPEEGKLYSLQIKSNPRSAQPGSKYYYQATHYVKLEGDNHSLNVGEKQYNHAISIDEANLKIDKKSRMTTTTVYSQPYKGTA